MTSSVEIQNWESKATLLAHLESNQSRAIVIGLTAEAPRAYYSLSVEFGESRIEVGVVSSGLGTEAAGVLVDNGRRMLVGHDMAVTWIDLERLVTGPSLPLGGVFFEFLTIDGEDDVVVLHELGALRASADGSVRWSVDTDIVQDANLDAGVLVLATMDGDRTTVSVASGDRVSARLR